MEETEGPEAQHYYWRKPAHQQSKVVAVGFHGGVFQQRKQEDWSEMMETGMRQKLWAEGPSLCGRP